VGLIVGFVVALELACRCGLLSPINVVPPSEMVTTLWHELVSGALVPEATPTLLCVLVSVVLAAVGGVALGAALHRWTRLRVAVNPILSSYYAIPIFAFYPGLAAVMGLGLAPIIIVSVLNAIIGMVIATIDGLDRFPRVLSRVGQVHHFSQWKQFWHLQLPAAAPSLLAGAKLVVAYSFIGVIGSEFLMAPAGLGYQIAYAYNNFDVPRMYALMLFVVLIVAVANALLAIPQRWVTARAAGRKDT
jgi:NitT/TauT family transport system permease protein